MLALLIWASPQRATCESPMLIARFGSVLPRLVGGAFFNFSRRRNMLVDR
jgi:hypothetical protein